MKPLILLLLSLMVTSPDAGSGEKHSVVPGTPGNRLTLEVANKTGRPLHELRARVASKPVWITLTGQSAGAPVFLPDSTLEITFTFTTAAELEAGKEDSLSIEVLSAAGVVAYRTIVLTGATPKEYALSQNYPNPFNPVTHIRYELPEESHVRLTVYDLLGREVVRLVDEQKAAGYLAATWDGRTSAGTTASSGVYFYRLEARGLSGGRTLLLKKMLLVK